MASEGPAGIYRAGYFLDYPPGYLYALWLAGIIANATGAGGVDAPDDRSRPRRWWPTFVLALLVFIFVRRTAPARRTAAYVAMLLVALNPALGFDTDRVGPERFGADGGDHAERGPGARRRIRAGLGRWPR